MYCMFRKNRIILLAVVIGIAVILCILAVISNDIEVFGNIRFRKSTDFVIDAGHGGVDPGAIGVNKVNEKDINLKIAMALRDILTVNGYNVLMIRTEDVSVNDPKYTKISAIKTSDLKNRLKLIESNSDAIAISIHQNEFVGKSSHGAQMFYGRKNEESPKLAEAIQKTFRKNLQPENKRQIKHSTSDVYIIHNAKNPIVLVECGFLSNPVECEKLCDEQYQRKVAFTIYEGICNYQVETTE